MRILPGRRLRLEEIAAGQAKNATACGRLVALGASGTAQGFPHVGEHVKTPHGFSCSFRIPRNVIGVTMLILW
jgi:hypothetical protein